MRMPLCSILIAMAVLFMPADGRAQAQDFPSRPIFIVVGPGPDPVARLVGQKMTEAWGQQVLIDLNRQRNGGGAQRRQGRCGRTYHAAHDGSTPSTRFVRSSPRS